MNDQALQLIRALHRGGTYGYWWTDAGRQSFWWEVGKETPLPSGKRNVYVGVHPTSVVPETNRHGEPAESRAVRSRIEHIAAVNCLFAEFDAKDFGGDMGATLAHIDALEPAPTATVRSGGGYHCYWLLEQPWALTTDAERQRAVKLQAAWVRLMGGDDAAIAAEALAHVPDRQERLAAIQHITNEGMSGRIDFQTSLQRRFIQLHPTAQHVDTVAKKLVAAINPSFARSKKTIQQEANRVWVVSGGFRELIEPVTDAFGIDRSHVLANTFVWDKERKNVVDYDHTNVLAGNDGKVAAVRSLHLNDDYVIVVGDGMTDYAVYAAGLADTCIAFTETVQRPELLAKADYSSDDIQFALNFMAPAATRLSGVFSAVTT